MQSFKRDFRINIFFSKFDEGRFIEKDVKNIVQKMQVIEDCDVNLVKCNLNEQDFYKIKW